MIEKQFQKGDAASTALYSPCGIYRYALTRVWDAGLGKLAIVMLNPSKATEVANDPTIERCERRARSLGYGGFRAVNLFAYRATDPFDMRRAAEPIGPDNDQVLEESAAWADLVLCAWGVHGAHLGRGTDVEALLRRAPTPLAHLGLTKDGHPRHPLYVSYKVTPTVWEAPHVRA